MKFKLLSNPFNIGALLSFFLLALIKYYYISVSLQEDSFLSTIFTGICQESSLFLLVSLMTVLTHFTNYIGKVFINFILIVIILIYSMDILAIVNLNSRFSFNEMYEFLSEWKQIFYFFDLLFLLYFGILFFAFFINISAKYIESIVYCLILLNIFSLSLHTNQLEKISYYNFLKILPNENDIESNNEYSKEKQLSSYLDYSKRKILSLPENHPNVILLVVESLSLLHSKRGGGLYNYTPDLDKLSEKGIYFTNFLANSNNSEGGLIALLSAVSPIKYYSFTRAFKYYNSKRSVPNFFNELGYKTNMLTTSPLDFINKGDYYKQIGFNSVRGIDEVPRFKNAKKFAFDSPSDEILYEEFLSSHDFKREKFFTVLTTTTSHIPFKSPDGKENTEKNVFKYVGEQIVSFYNKLNENKFFENGILIILGDHRKMQIIPKSELDSFGPSAKARIPLIILGKNVPTNKVDRRLFQQSDLFPNLNQAISSDEELSTEVLYTNLQDMGLIDIFYLDSNKIKSSKMSIVGKKIIWDVIGKNKLEEKIHQQRAAWQYIRKTEHKKCTFSTQKYNSGVRVYKIKEILETFEGSKIQKTIPVSTLKEFNSLDLKELGKKGSSFIFNLKINIDSDGQYFFKFTGNNPNCLGINNQTVLDYDEPFTLGIQPRTEIIFLKKGIYNLELRQSYHNDSNVSLEWGLANKATDESSNLKSN